MRCPQLLATIIVFGCLICVGCDLGPTLRAFPLPVPPAEQPPCNLPARLHQKNELGPLRQGSCVHASLKSHLEWHNQHELAVAWWGKYHDGEYDSRLMQRLDAAGVEYAFTQKADPRFLDWCSLTRKGCILWWKPSHCCTFMGWVTRDGQQFAAILDNNNVGKFELTPREQFVRLWAGYGGFALSVLYDPASSFPYLSYEVKDE